MPHDFPLCAVTRSMTNAHQALEILPTHEAVEEPLLGEEEKEEEDFDLACLFYFSILHFRYVTEAATGRSALIVAQQQDVSLQTLLEEARSQTGDSSPTTSYFFR